MQARIRDSLTQDVFTGNESGFGVDLFFRDVLSHLREIVFLRADGRVHALARNQDLTLRLVGGRDHEHGDQAAREDSAETQQEGPLVAEADAEQIAQREVEAACVGRGK